MPIGNESRNGTHFLVFSFNFFYLSRDKHAHAHAWYWCFQHVSGNSRWQRIKYKASERQILKTFMTSK